MANPIPALLIARFKGSGNVTVHKLLGGTTIDPTQDGNDVLAGTLENPVNDHNNQANRLVEAFGKRFLLHGWRVYERDEGGDGNWGEVTGLGFSATGVAHGGLHLLNAAGTPTLGFLWSDGSAHIHATYTEDGSSWSDIAFNLGSGTDRGFAGSVVWGSTIAWYCNGNNTNCVKVFDFASSTGFQPSGLTGIKNNSGNCYLAAHKGYLFVLAPDVSNNLNLYRVSGTTASFIHQIPGPIGTFHISSNGCLFSDGDDLVSFWSTSSQRRSVRYSDILPGGSPAADIGTAILGPLAFNDPSAFYPFVSIDPDPSAHEQRVYFWYRRGDINTGDYELFRFNYREITHGSVTAGPFIVGSRVLQANSLAEGTITDVGAGKISLTDVTGTFNDSDVISTVGGGASASATAFLVDVAVTPLGTGPSAANYGLPSVLNGGLDRVPVKGNARPEIEGLPTEVQGGKTKWFFRVRGTGGDPIDLQCFFDLNEEAPQELATLVNGSLVVESGSPSTVPTISDGATISNITPDAGGTLYSFEHDADADLVPEGQGYTVSLDIA